MAGDPAGGGRSRVDRSRRRLLAATGGLAAGALSGCLVRGDDSGLRGEIRIDGSNTLLPHGAAVAEEFQWLNNRVQLPVRGSGTGAGFQRFCVGETHVQNASRSMLDEEAELAAEHGIEYVALEAVLDGIAVFVNPANTWCEELTVEELHAIWDADSEVETWRDIRAEWPDEEIELYGRDSGSGTFDYFTEAINREIARIRPDYSASADTNVIVRGVRGDEHALGWGGAGYFFENEEDLKLVGIDDGDGAVEPSRKTIEDGSYSPLSRAMYVYVRTDTFDREEVRAFTRFFFEEVDEETHEDAVELDYAAPGESLTWTQLAARRVGFYAIPDETVEESAATLEEAIAQGHETTGGGT